MRKIAIRAVVAAASFTGLAATLGAGFKWG